MKSITDKLKAARIHEYAGLLIATLAVFCLIYYVEFFHPQESVDFHAHLTWAQNIIQNPEKVPQSIIAHSAWQWLVVFGNKVLGLSWGISGLFVTLASVFIAAGILYWIFRKKCSPLLSGSLSLGLLLVAPIFIIEPLAKNTYFVDGYISPNVYHNPTILLLKPLAILQFIFSVHILQGVKKRKILILCLAFLSGFAVFSKPSFIICLLPSLAILVLFLIYKKTTINWVELMFGIVIPSVVILIWQYTLTFGANATSSVVFAPFVVMKSVSTHLLEKFLLSIVFPLVTTIACWKKAIKDQKVQLGWLCFIFGSFFVYLFNETAQHQIAANYYWSAEISLFILFVSCVWFLIENPDLLTNLIRKWLIFASGFLHIAFGLYFYFYIIS